MLSWRVVRASCMVCAWVCAIVVRAAVPSEVLRLGDSVRTGTGRAGPQGRGLSPRLGNFTHSICRFRLSTRATHQAGTDRSSKEPQTAAPRESRGVTRADFVHHSSYRIHSGLITTHVRHISRYAHISQCRVRKSCRRSSAATRLPNTPNKYNAVQLECSVLQSRPPICLDSPPTLTQPPA